MGVPLRTGGEVWGGLCLLPRNFFEFLYQNSKFLCILCSKYSYRLADCFTRIGNTPGIEIYWRSFQHFGNRPIITPSGKLRAKKRQKLLKEIARRLHCFFLVHFRIYFILLKFFKGGGLRAWPPIAPLTTPLCIPHAVLIFDPSQCFLSRTALKCKARSCDRIMLSICL